MIDVPAGTHVVELDHRVHTDLIAGLVVAALTIVLWCAITLRSKLARA
jgi:hypothetical protein